MLGGSGCQNEGVAREGCGPEPGHFREQSQAGHHYTG